MREDILNGVSSLLFIERVKRVKDVNVYTNLDGRTRAYIKETKKVVSYPRLLLEEKIGRPLEKNEQVHHIDGDPLNNDVSNLEIKRLGEHQRDHNVKYFDKEVECAWCGKKFIWKAIQQRTHRGNCKDSKPFCSKSCCGSYGRYKQLNAGVAK